MKLSDIFLRKNKVEEKKAKPPEAEASPQTDFSKEIGDTLRKYKEFLVRTETDISSAASKIELLESVKNSTDKVAITYLRRGDSYHIRALAEKLTGRVTRAVVLEKTPVLAFNSTGTTISFVFKNDNQSYKGLENAYFEELHQKVINNAAEALYKAFDTVKKELTERFGQEVGMMLSHEIWDQLEDDYIIHSGRKINLQKTYDEFQQTPEGKTFEKDCGKGIQESIQYIDNLMTENATKRDYSIIHEEDGSIVAINRYGVDAYESQLLVQKGLQAKCKNMGFDSVDVKQWEDPQTCEVYFETTLKVENTPEKNRTLRTGFWNVAVSAQQSKIENKISGWKGVKSQITEGIERKNEMPQIFLSALKKSLGEIRIANTKPIPG
jgi:hypothetical protein